MYCLRSWSIYIRVMESCMTAPSHYLKQCGLIIKLINNVLWHLSQWIIITDLKIPISKMRLKLVCWDNFTPSPEIIHLFSSDNSFVCVMAVIVRRAGLLWSQQDFEWRWSVPLFKCLTVLEFSFILFHLFINHIFQFYYELCTYCNILDIYLS